MATPYEQFTQNQQDETGNVYDFWANVYKQFNPQAPQMQATNTTPNFLQATQDTIGGMNRAVGNGANSGAFHSGMAGNRFADINAQKANQANLGYENEANKYNFGETEKYGEGGLGRMEGFTGIQNRMNQFPTDRTADQLALQDTINNMNAKYNASKGDWFNSLMGGLGQVGGTLLGKKLGGSNSGQNQDTQSLDDIMKNYNLTNGQKTYDPMGLMNLSGTGGGY